MNRRGIFLAIAIMVCAISFSCTEKGATKKSTLAPSKVETGKKKSPKPILAIDHEATTTLTPANATFRQIPSDMPVTAKWWLPIKDNIIGAWFVGENIYVQTDNYLMYSFDAGDGTTNWIQLVPVKITAAPVVTKHKLAVMCGSQIIEISMYTGAIVRKEFLPVPPIESPVYSGEKLLVGSVNGTVQAFSGDNLSSSWDCRLDSTLSAPLTIAKIFLLAPCVNGSLNAISLKKGEEGSLSWTFQSEGTLFVPPLLETTNENAKDERSIIYQGSADHNIYALSIVGKKLWAYRTDGMINVPPLIGTDRKNDEGLLLPFSGNLFVLTNKQSLFAIHKKSGQCIWKSTAAALIGTVKDNLYVWTTTGKIAAFNQSSGQVVGEWSASAFKAPVTNNAGQYLYLISQNNEIFCLEAKKTK